ncbi:MAG TPA: hypothetical protein VMD59_14575 [Acidimicrobiales bacterium]|nr:hypothetical protein [Acidimicrobiales bacterium]
MMLGLSPWGAWRGFFGPFGCGNGTAGTGTIGASVVEVADGGWVVGVGSVG